MIVRADIQFNGGLYKFVDAEDQSAQLALTKGEAWDMRSVALHELGHLLGLEHCEENDSVMRATVGPGRDHILHVLGVGDAERIRKIFTPRNLPTRNISVPFLRE